MSNDTLENGPDSRHSPAKWTEEKAYAMPISVRGLPKFSRGSAHKLQREGQGRCTNCICEAAAFEVSLSFVTQAPRSVPTLWLGPSKSRWVAGRDSVRESM